MPRRRRQSNPSLITLPTSRSLLRRGGDKALIGIAGTGFLVWFASHADESTLAILVVIGLFIAAGIAGVWWFEREAKARAKRELIARQHGLASIAQLSWPEFEELVGELYRQRGFNVTPRARGGADGGIDIVLELDGALTLVQCKHWKSTTVGAPIVREMMGIIFDQRAVAGKIVCSGKFTRQAVEFAKGKPIELVNGEALWSLVEETKRAMSAPWNPQA
ncbi:MAG: restriction endonuclease [Trinickia sp.]|uniref:restriction endonuclease n=1 Tax=Trinickia sp. TaxID=2571163 RepID=UPI003F80F5B8